MREYLKTHPWITFDIPTAEARPVFWMLLARAQAKVEDISRAPLYPDTAKELAKISLARGVLATTAIEGNTLTEDEVIAELDGKSNLPPSRAYLGTEVRNVVRAINQVGLPLLERGDDKFSTDLLCQYNAMVLQNLELREDVVPGVVRKHLVRVGDYIGAPSEDLPFLLDRYCDWLNSRFDPPPEQKAYQLAFGLLRAIAAHLYFAWIHPFADGNGRTARLIEFHCMLAAGVPHHAAHLLSNFYNQTRSKYYLRLDRSSKSGVDGVLEFFEYALEGFCDSLDLHLETIYGEQLRSTWRSYALDSLYEKGGEVGERLRKLVTDLADHCFSTDMTPVPLKELSSVSPRVLGLYNGRTPKTIRRDVNQLIRLGLVQQHEGGYTPNLQTMQSLLPARRVLIEDKNVEFIG